jgi:hypothetical protein
VFLPDWPSSFLPKIGFSLWFDSTTQVKMHAGTCDPCHLRKRLLGLALSGPKTEVDRAERGVVKLTPLSTASLNSMPDIEGEKAN